MPGCRGPCPAWNAQTPRGPDMPAPPEGVDRRDCRDPGQVPGTSDTAQPVRGPKIVSQAPRIATGATRRHDEPVQPLHLPARVRPVPLRTEAAEGAAGGWACRRDRRCPLRPRRGRPEPGVNASSDQYPWTDTTCRAGTPSRPRPHIQQKSWLSARVVRCLLVHHQRTQHANGYPCWPSGCRLAGGGADTMSGPRTPHDMSQVPTSCSRPLLLSEVPGAVRRQSSRLLCAGSLRGCRPAAVAAAVRRQSFRLLRAGSRTGRRTASAAAAERRQLSRVRPGTSAPACPLTRRVASWDFQGATLQVRGCPLWWRVRPEAEAEAEQGGTEPGTEPGPGRRRGGGAGRGGVRG